MAACSFTLSPQQLANGVELVVQGNDILASYGPDSTPESTQQSTDTNKSSTRSRPWTQEETDALLTFVQSMGTTEHYIWTECSDYLKSLNISRTALSCVRRYNQIVREQEEDMGVEYLGKTRAIQVQTEVSIPPSEEVTWTQKISKPTVFGPFSSMVELEEFLLMKRPPQGPLPPATPFTPITPVNSISGTRLGTTLQYDQLEPSSSTDAPSCNNEPVTEEYEHTLGIYQECVPREPVIVNEKISSMPISSVSNTRLSASSLSDRQESISFRKGPGSEHEVQPVTEECDAGTDHTYGKGQQCDSVEPVIEESSLAASLKRARMGPIPIKNKHRKRLRYKPKSKPKLKTADVELAGDQSPEHRNFKHNLKVCSRYLNLEYDMMKTLLSAGINLRSLMDLEEGFLELSTSPKCCEGTFYLSVFQVQGQVYMRYIESGSYRGSFGSVYDLISPILPISAEGAVWSQVYNEGDVQYHGEQQLKKDKLRLRTDTVYRRHMCFNKGSVKKCITALQNNLIGKKDDCRMLGMVVHTKYSRQQSNVEDKWYIHCSDSFGSCMQQLQEFFQQYPLTSQPYQQCDSSFLLKNCLTEDATLQDQCQAISLIPNYPRKKPKMNKFEHKLPALDRCPHSSRGAIIWARFHPKRSKYLEGACLEMCSESTQVAVENLVMTDPQDETQNACEVICAESTLTEGVYVDICSESTQQVVVEDTTVNDQLDQMVHDKTEDSVSEVDGSLPPVVSYREPPPGVDLSGAALHSGTDNTGTTVVYIQYSE